MAVVVASRRARNARSHRHGGATCKRKVQRAPSRSGSLWTTTVSCVGFDSERELLADIEDQVSADLVKGLLDHVRAGSAAGEDAAADGSWVEGATLNTARGQINVGYACVPITSMPLSVLAPAGLLLYSQISCPNNIRPLVVYPSTQLVPLDEATARSVRSAKVPVPLV